MNHLVKAGLIMLVEIFVFRCDPEEVMNTNFTKDLLV